MATNNSNSYYWSQPTDNKDVESDDDSNSNSNCNSDSEQETDLLKKIDQKIIIKYMREGKTSRTYMIGVHNYFKKEEDLTTYMKNLQKKLGTSFLKKMVDDIPHFGFAGEHIDKIYEELLKNKIAKKHEIKKQ